MKLKSLILGSIAAAGLSTAGFAADLGVLTSLDVCDELGLSGLTISSDTNCLQISGEVKYEFNWGNFNDQGVATTQFGTRNISFPGSFAGTPLVNGTFSAAGAAGPVSAPSVAAAAVLLGVAPAAVVTITAPTPAVAANPAQNNDWNSKVEAWLKFVGTAGSDFGPASVVITVKEVQHQVAANTVSAVGGDNKAVNFDEAYVQVGDTTVLTAGKRGSIFNKGDDEPFNFTGLFIASAVDVGVANENPQPVLPGVTAPAGTVAAGPKTGGHVIQLWSNIGEGLIAKIGLENLNDGNGPSAGTLVGVLDYAGSGITAHISGAAGGLLDTRQTTDDTYAVHAGVTATFDQFKVRAAVGAGARWAPAGFANDYWNGLVSAEAKFDMFKIALSGEASHRTVNGVDNGTDYGFGGSIGATVAEGIEINLGGRYFNDATIVNDTYQVAAQLIAALTETVKLTGEVGIVGVTPTLPAFSSDFYAKAELGWTPGGGFSSSVGATVQQNGAYKVTFKAAKSFQ